MAWEKRGLVYCPNGASAWIDNTALTPEPFLLNEDVIRIYCSFRDKSGVGRIGFVDVEAQNPKNVLRISKEPALDIGKKGCFDDNGMILGAVLRVGSRIYMYYVAFQIPQKVKFLAFSGLAVSEDGGESFHRVQETPVLDRSAEGVFGRCLHSVLYEKGVFRIYYSVIYDWEMISGIPYPRYDIKYAESKDGVNFPKDGVSCVQCVGNEYRIGRPKVYRTQGGYEMYYTLDTLDKEYKSGFATSSDGIYWQRHDELFPLQRSKDGFDSQMLCYPALLEVGSRKYMFYCGNGMGRDGFGVAEFVR